MLRSGRWIFVLVLLASMVGAPSVRAESNDKPDFFISSTENDVRDIVNRIRTHHGLRSLAFNPVMRREARRHSSDMADDHEVNTDGFDHTVDEIVDDDDGVDPTKVCEAVTRVKGAPASVGRAIVDRLRSTTSGLNCLFDGNGYNANVDGVGVVFFNGAFWATFLAAHDSSP